MKYLILIAILVATALPVAAQPNMDGMDFPPLMWQDGMRIFFDASVTWAWGGILQNPLWELWQTTTVTDAYLVLTHPTRSELGGYQVRMSLEGNHIVLSEEVVGLPLSVLLDGDELTVAYDPPRPMNGDPVVLYHWSLLNVPFTPVSFYLMPPAAHATPVYFDGAGATVPSNTYNGAGNEYAIPVAMLNGATVDNEIATWSDVKALFR